MQSETIVQGQKIRFTTDCGRTYQVGTLKGFNEKFVTVTTRKQITVPTFYRFAGVIKIKNGTTKEWRNVEIKLDASVACNSVVSLAQYAQIAAYKRAMTRLVAIANATLATM